MYIDFYPPGYNPNFRAQGLSYDAKFSENYYKNWKLEEKSASSIDTILLRQGVTSTILYTLTTIKKLKTNIGWNNIGFSPSYDESQTVQSFFRDSPQRLSDISETFGSYTSAVSSVIVKPNGFTLITDTGQKVFTLLNIVAQIGGVLGLFVSLQTILFGFRPQSPWGNIHRWSFGSLRAELTDKLADSFNEMGKPVPLFDPVCNRLNSADRQNRLGSGSSSTSNNAHLTGEDIDMQDDRKYRIEDRLHLMERVLKNYYLDDEIFRSLKKIADRNRENANNVQHENNCSLTQNYALKEDNNDNNTDSLTNNKSKSSSLISHTRNQKLRPGSFNHKTRLISCDEEYK